MTDDDTCGVCFDRFNRAARTRVSCPGCGTGVCRTCIQKHVLSLPGEPACASCGHEWTQDAVDALFTATFCNGPLRAKRELAALEREKARLPETQAAAERVRTADAELAAANAEIAEITARFNLERDEYLRTWEERCAVELHVPRRRAYVARTTIDTWGANLTDADIENGLEESDRDRRAFVRPCPADDCRGFLTTRWRCPMCEARVCPDCHVVLGFTPDAGAGHECDADAAATVAEVNAHSKPCPKCGARISKVSGCDQMWCTACRTAFSWSTLRIETTRVHNPHYYEWMRQRGTEPPREPGDDPCGAHGLPLYYPEVYMIAGHGLADAHQVVNHWLEVELPRARRVLAGTPGSGPEGSRDLRVKYLLGKIDDAALQRELGLRHRKLARTQARLQIIEAFAGAGADIFRRVVLRTTSAAEAETELTALMEFTNAAVVAFRRRHKTTMNTVFMILGATAHGDHDVFDSSDDSEAAAEEEADRVFRAAWR